MNATNTYTATIDSGEGGETTFAAATVDAALALAVEWAEGGEYREDGTVIVRVSGPDGDRTEYVRVTAAA